jgi:tRNA (cmo5U34)-methyltransferase
LTDNSTAHLSNDYDSLIKKTIPFYDDFHKETIEIIKCIIPLPNSWLDTGCGTGTLIEKALPEFPSTEFYLCDPSIGMMEQAKNKLQQFNKKVQFLNSMQTNEISDELNEKYDVITAIQSHHYMSVLGRISATKKCYELLKKSGVYITFENTKPLTEEGIEIGKCHWSKFQINQGRDINIVEKHMSRFNEEYFPITVEEHLELLRAAGFKVIELFWFSFMQSGYYCIK